MMSGGKSPHVVFADDNDDDYVLLNCAVQKAGLPAVLDRVKDGTELMQYWHHEGAYAGTTYSTPVLVLLDLNMPRKDGREALREIRSDPVLRALPVVVLTTSRALEDVQVTYAAGANSFITKPSEFKNLVAMVEVLKRYWFEVVVLPPSAVH